MDGSPDRPAGNKPGGEPRKESIPFSLSFVDGKGRLSLNDIDISPLHIEQLELDITGLSFPFDLTGGPSRLRDRWLESVLLKLSIPFDVILDTIETLKSARKELTDLHVDVDADALEVVGRLGESLDSPWFVIRYVTDVADERDLLLRPALFVVFGSPVISFQQVAAQVARLPLPALSPDGFDLRTKDIPKTVLKGFLPTAGYRIPDCRRLRLSSVELDRRQGAKLSFAQKGGISAVPSAVAMAIGEVQTLLRPGDDAAIEGDLEGARSLYLEALGQEPGHDLIVERLAWLDVINPTRTEAARIGCERALDARDTPGLRAVLGSLLIKDGAYQEAAAHFRALNDHLGPLGQSRLLFLLGKLKLEVGEPSGAATLLESALALDPSLIDALGLLRDCYVALGQRRQLQAVAARLTASAARPEVRVQLLTDLGTMWHQHFGDIYKATDCFEQALLHQPDAPEALIGLAECYAAKGEYHAALRCLDATAKVAAMRDDGPLEVSVHIRAGELWEEVGDLTSASARYHRALSIDPASTVALERAAEIDVSLERFDIAMAGYGMLISFAARDGDHRRWRSALIRLTRLQIDTFEATGPALAALELFLNSHPDDVEIKALLIEASRESSTPDEAPLLKHFEEIAPPPAPAPDFRAPPETPTMAPPDAPTVMPQPEEWPDVRDPMVELATIVELAQLEVGPDEKVEEGEEDEYPTNEDGDPSLFEPDPASDLFSAIARATDSATAASKAGGEMRPQDDDVETLLQAHLSSSGDDALADKVISRLEEEEDWTRLAAVLSGTIENLSSSQSSRRVSLLCHLAEVLIEGLEDRQSGAECLLRVASVVPPAEGAAHARRAAALLRHEGLGDLSADAEALAERLASEGRGHE